jgi:hypothetical protein
LNNNAIGVNKGNNKEAIPYRGGIVKYLLSYKGVYTRQTTCTQTMKNPP